MKVLRGIDRVIGAVTVTGVVATMAGMSLVILAQIYFRYIAGAALPWSEELARYLMVWLAFLGGAVALRRGEHVGVTVFRDRAPRTLRLVVTLVGHVIVLVLLGFVVYLGYEITMRNMAQVSPAMRVPIGYATAAIPVGSAFMAIEATKLLVKTALELSRREREEAALDVAEDSVDRTAGTA